MTFDEGDKNIEGPTAERNRLARFHQEALLGKQAEAVEPDGGRGGETRPFLGRWRRSASLLVIERRSKAAGTSFQQSSAVR